MPPDEERHDRALREQRTPGLLGRENWVRYSAGLVTEVVYILALTLLAFLIAVGSNALVAYLAGGR